MTPHEDVDDLDLAARAAMTWVSARAEIAAGALLALLGASWAVTWFAGGAAVVAPHGYHVPVVLAALRFGGRGAVVVGLVAGVLAGPLTPALVTGPVAQAPTAGISRTVAFVVAGLVVAWLLRHTLSSLRQDAALAQADRELADAIDAGELTLRYQPVVHSRSGALLGFEALVRWDHPDGERTPARFLPTAEATGRIRQIGDLVLHEACRQAATWADHAAAAGRRPPTVSVNLSPQELSDADLVDRVSTALASSGLDGRSLCLEITEEGLTHDIDLVATRLHRLRQQHGVRIAVDDFGSGYASLSYIHRFPLDVLKIDRSFVEEMEHSVRARAVAAQILEVCRTLEVTPVIEGLETLAHLATAQELGDHLAQGFQIARPMSRADADAWLIRTPMACESSSATPLAPVTAVPEPTASTELGPDRDGPRAATLR